MPYIVSSMAAPVKYVTYAKRADGKPVAKARIEIKGGANVADRRTLIAPGGVVTSVTPAELTALKLNPVFNEQVASGYLKILNADPRDADRAAADLAKDAGAQITPGDYTGSGKQAPKTGAAEK